MKQVSKTSLLTKEQLELRQTGIGASEIAAVCGISPWATPLDVWMKKSTPTRGPIIDSNIDSMAIRLGNHLEEPLRQLYEQETGLVVSKPDMTFRHPAHPFILATPDGVVNSFLLTDLPSSLPSKGLEIKNVGARMMSAWDEGVPDYVEMQARQNMAVLGYETWDVAALLGGSEFRIFTIERDLDIEEIMIDSARHFWEEYVMKDVAPPETNPESKRKMLEALFPKNTHKQCKVPVDVEYYKELCEELIHIKDTEKELKASKTSVENSLIEMIGEDYGIDDPYTGKVTYGYQNGNTSYKDIATELAGGEIPADIIEKHRGEGKRVFRFTAPKVGK